jgi:hypothetical protein
VYDLPLQRSKMEETTLSSSNVNPVSSCDVTEVRDSVLVIKLSESEAKIQELEDSNQRMKMEILVLQRMVSLISDGGSNINFCSYEILCRLNLSMLSSSNMIMMKYSA